MILKPKLITKIEPGHWASKGLVGSWIFNEGGGDLAYDTSGNGNHGTLVGDTHSVPGKFGPALDFNGATDYVNVGVAFTPGVGDFSIVATVRLNVPSADSNPVIVARGSSGTGEWMFRVASGNSAVSARLGFYGDGGGIILQGSNGSFENDVWYHCVFVRKNGIAYLYQDAVLIDTDATAFDNLNSTDDTRIGDGDSLNRVWNGQISDVIIWNRALNASEIKELYRDPFQMFKRNL